MEFNTQLEEIQKELQTLEALTLKNNYFFSGEFRWRSSPSEEMWGLFNYENNGFRGTSSPETLLKAEQFYFFGAMGDGSLIALWKKKSEEIPVVYFGSEGDYKVLAKNFESWLQLMAIGYNECGYEDIYDPPANIEGWELEYHPQFSAGRVASWFKDYLNKKNINIPTDGKEIYLSRQELHREFLATFFDTAYLYCDYMQFFLTTEADTTSITVPEKITEEDIQRGYEVFPQGIAFYFEDSNNLSTEISLTITNDTIQYPEAYQAINIPIVVTKNGLTVFNLFRDTYKFTNPKLVPGNYKLHILKAGGPSEKSPHRGHKYYLCLEPTLKKSLERK